VTQVTMIFHNIRTAQSSGDAGDDDFPRRTDDPGEHG
jgi:hypothetical protein